MTPVKTRFVILSAPRSGTTVLAQMLDSHPDILCHGVPYVRTTKQTAGLRSRVEHLLDLTRMTSAPVNFAKEVLDASTGESAVGFKIWPNGDPKRDRVLKTILADSTIKKIILRRRNPLACYSAAAFDALVRTRPNLFQDQNLPPRLDFDESAFHKMTAERNAAFGRYNRNAKGDVLVVDYEQLTRDAPARIAAFLGVAPFNFKHPLQETARPDILRRFKPSQHAAIRRVLNVLGHPEWRYEGTKAPQPALSRRTRVLRRLRYAFGVLPVEQQPHEWRNGQPPESIPRAVIRRLKRRLGLRT